MLTFYSSSNNAKMSIFQFLKDYCIFVCFCILKPCINTIKWVKKTQRLKQVLFLVLLKKMIRCAELSH